MHTPSTYKKSSLREKWFWLEWKMTLDLWELRDLGGGRSRIGLICALLNWWDRTHWRSSVWHPMTFICRPSCALASTCRPSKQATTISPSPSTLLRPACNHWFRTRYIHYIYAFTIVIYVAISTANVRRGQWFHRIIRKEYIGYESKTFPEAFLKIICILSSQSLGFATVKNGRTSLGRYRIEYVVKKRFRFLLRQS